MGKIEKTLLILIYLGINNLFIFKYGIRQNYIDVLYLLLVFPLVIFLIFYSVNRYNFNPKNSKIIYFFIVLLFFSFSIVLNILIDGNNLNVDRWSAMDVSISAILDGKYPYMQLDHLNGRSSNLPGLILIGLPFYLLGNVGYLQSFTFLLFAYTLHKTINNYKAKILGILLLISSLFYLWEVFVKSDLMSNFIIILCFITLWYKKYNNQELKKPFLLGVLTSFVFFTRLVSIIPLIIFLFNAFIKSSVLKKILFMISSILTISILSFIVLKNCPSLNVFKNYNPFSLQNRQLPLIISVIMIIIPFFYSKKSITLASLIKYCLIFISVPIFFSFFLSVFKYGLHDIIYNSVFDLSYFNILTPFLIYYIALRYNKTLGMSKING